MSRASDRDAVKSGRYFRHVLHNNGGLTVLVRFSPHRDLTGLGCHLTVCHLEHSSANVAKLPSLRASVSIKSGVNPSFPGR